MNAQSVIYSDNWDISDLTTAQTVRYNKILNFVAEDKILPIGIDSLSFVENNRISIDIPISTCDNTTFKGKRIEYSSEEDYEWYGELEYEDTSTCTCRYGYLLLLSKDGEKFGQIKLEEEFYTITDLGEGKWVLVQEPADEGPLPYEAQNLPVGVQDSTFVSTRSEGNCTVKVLVLYTPAADERMASMEQLVKSSIAITNQAFRNSAISTCELRLELVAMEEFGLDETAKTFQEVLFEVSSSPSNPDDPDGPARRAFYHADIVVLFVDQYIMDPQESALGVAFLGPSSTNAYGVVSAPRNNHFVFSHEVGHLLGAKHEPCDAEDAGDHCDDTGDFEHAHTWSYETGCWWSKETVKRRTIEYSLATADNIQYYSNPDVEVEGYSTGVEGERDNAQMLKNNACVVANFDTGDESLVVTINGQNQMCPLDNACLQASISGLPGPYSYEWKFSASGTDWNTQAVVGTTDFYCFSMPNPLFGVGDVVYFRLKVTAGNGEITYAYHSIEIVEDGYGGFACFKIKTPEKQELKKLQVAPNPTGLNYVDVSFSLQSESSVRIEIYDTKGNLVGFIDEGVQPAGTFETRIDLNGFVEGTYFLQVKTDAESGRLHFIKLR